LPKEPTEIKPHPHGIELGILMRMLRLTKQRTVRAFLMKEFSRVGAGVADNILGHLKLENKKPEELERGEVEALLKALQKAPLQRPPTDCLSPIGEEALEKSVRAETKAEFVVANSRKPTVYRGMPFVIEAVIAYGGEVDLKGQAQRLRFANKIPLLYDAGGCAITQAIQEVDWKRYSVANLTSNNIPIGPYVILVHLASVWVPYTSEGKGAVASYPEIIKEMKLAIQECARKISVYTSGKRRAQIARERRNLFESYIPELAEDLSKLSGEAKTKIVGCLEKTLKKGVPEGTTADISSAKEMKAVQKTLESVENGESNDKS
jgi:DNA topoisomerase-6 subunit B